MILIFTKTLTVSKIFRKRGLEIDYKIKVALTSDKSKKGVYNKPSIV